MPHVLLVGGDGHPSGVPRHITDLARALQGQARITVASEADRGGYGALADLGARHVALPGLASRLTPGSLRRGRAALAAFLGETPADLVWFHARLPVILGRRLLITGDWRPDAATRIALTYHGLPFGRGHRHGTALLSRRLERQLLGRCPPLELVFLTEDQRQRMTTTLGPELARHHTHVLGNASSLGPVPPPLPRPAGRHLVMTGRAGWQKNYDAALRLLRHLPDDITLSLCGAGTETPAFAARAARLAGPAVARLRLLGPLSDVRPLLASADGYMLTSRYEGLPIGALEACEYGLPLALADFDGAEALLADHPLGLCLKGALPTQAHALDRLLARYLADRPAQSAAIRRFWAMRWSPGQFDSAARALVAGWLPSPTAPSPLST